MFELIDNLLHILVSRGIVYTVELREDELDVYFTHCKVRYFPNEKHLIFEETNGTEVHFDNDVLITCNGDYLVFSGSNRMYYVRLNMMNKTKDIVVD